MSDNTSNITDKWQTIKEKFLARTKENNQSVEPRGHFYGWLVVAKDRDDYIRTLEIEGYRLAHDKKLGLTVVDRFGKAYSIEKTLEGANITKLKLGDLQTLPSIEDAKRNFNEHMRKVLPDHFRHLRLEIAQRRIEMDSTILKQSRMFQSEKRTDASSERTVAAYKDLCRLLDSKMWNQREDSRKMLRLVKDISSYRDGPKQMRKSVEPHKGKGIGL